MEWYRKVKVLLSTIKTLWTYGPDTIEAIKDVFDSDDAPTPEEIRAYKITKTPREYFDE